MQNRAQEGNPACYNRVHVLSSVRSLSVEHSTSEAMSLAVGGSFEAFGVLMRQVLLQAGLQPDHYVVDVGCGSGRLATALAAHPRCRYLGTDIVPSLLEHARVLCDRWDWRFELVDDIVIPEIGSSADVVCFFSVFTHLLHEDSWRYLCEAHRVLKPGGIAVLSFLEFALPCAWAVFEQMIEASIRKNRTVHNQFLSRDAIEVWAAHAGFEVAEYHYGEEPYLRLPHPLKFDDGTIAERIGSLGQSLYILRRR